MPQFIASARYSNGKKSWNAYAEHIVADVLQAVDYKYRHYHSRERLFYAFEPLWHFPVAVKDYKGQRTQ